MQATPFIGPGQRDLTRTSVANTRLSNAIDDRARIVIDAGLVGFPVNGSSGH